MNREGQSMDALLTFHKRGRGEEIRFVSVSGRKCGSEAVSSSRRGVGGLDQKTSQQH